MTFEAEVAKDAAYDIECKKDGFRQVQSGDVKLTLTLNPQDIPATLYTDAMGQRYRMFLVPLNDDDTPRPTIQNSGPASQQAAPEAAPHKRPTPLPAIPLPYVKRAAMLSNDPDFWIFAKVSSAEEAADHIRHVCGVNSRRDIDGDADAMRAFDLLYNSADHWKKYERNVA